MSCPHGIWHNEDCERCVELADHEHAYALLFAENGKLRAEIERLASGVALPRAPEPCGLRYMGGIHSTWKCDTCGYKGVHDQHPGCRRTAGVAPTDGGQQ